MAQQRYYDPAIGRFLSVDPVRANSGPGFNRYSYANNNPYRFTDPDGRRSCQTPRDCGGAGAAYIGNSTSGVDVNSAAEIGMANIPRSWQKNTHVAAGPAPNPNGSSAQRRFNAASQEVVKVRESAESKPYDTPEDATNYFYKVFQPISEKYLVEIFAEIGTWNNNKLTGIHASRFIYTGGAPFSGSPTIHSHFVVSDSPKGYEPFSGDDVDWYMSTPTKHYLTDPAGAYRYNDTSEPPTRIGP